MPDVIGYPSCIICGGPVVNCLFDIRKYPEWIQDTLDYICLSCRDRYAEDD